MGKGVKDPELDREKQSHVQRHNFAKRKQLKEEQDLPSESEDSSRESLWREDSSHRTEIDTGWEAFAAYSDPVSQPQSLQFYQAFEASTSQSTDSEASHTYKPGCYFDSVPDRHQPSKTSYPPLEFPLQRYPLQATTAHPLFSGSTQILQKWAPPLMQHYNTIVVPEKFFQESRLRPIHEMRHAASIHDQSSKALTQPVHLYSFLALASIHMVVREGRLLLPDVKEEDHQRVPLYFKGKAMDALRKALAAGVTHDLVHDVHRLVAVCYFSHAYESAMPHFDAMMSMIDFLGGIKTFDDYFQESHILLDWSAGLRRLLPPRLPFTWDPGHGPPAIAEKLQSLDTSIDGLGQRMRLKIAEDGINLDLSAVFEDTLQLTRFHRWAIDAPYEPENFRYILLRQIAIGCRLLFMDTQLQPQRNIREETFRIALIFYIAQTRSPSGRRCASVSCAQLRTTIESSTPEDWEGHEDLFLWIVVVGGLTAIEQSEVDWYARLAAQTAKRLDEELYVDFAGMEALLEGFLYEPVMQREPLLDFRARMRRVSAGGARDGA